MRKQNKLIFFQNTVYGLAKDYGFRCDLYRPTETIDYQTGRKIVTRIKYPIKKAIFFPDQLFRDYKYATAFTAGMQFGGILDASQRRVLINRKYLPKDFVIQVTDYLIFDHERYEIVTIDEMTLANYYHLIVKSVEGIPRSETFDRRIKDSMDIVEDAYATP